MILVVIMLGPFKFLDYESGPDEYAFDFRRRTSRTRSRRPSS
jgi:hypothetical protein